MMDGSEFNFSSKKHAQRRISKEQDTSRDSSTVRRHHFSPSEHDDDVFSRIVIVHAADVRKVTNGYPDELTDLRSTGHREPTEHPNDNPGISESGTCKTEHPVLSDFENLSVRTPSEHLSHGHPYQAENKHPDIPWALSKAMLQSKQRVAEWKSDPLDNMDFGQSFVIDQYSDTLASEMSLLEGEQHRNISRPSHHSASFLNSGLTQEQAMIAHHAGQDDTSSLPRSECEENDDSSDGETGLRKSLSFIQRPPDVDGSCSRQNSNGSQSSLDSSLSFHTVYPSGENYTQNKAPMHRNREWNKYQPRITSPPPAQLDVQQNTASVRLPVTTSTEQYSGRSQSQAGPYGYNRSAGQSGVRQINQRADEASRQEHAQKATSVFITYAEERHDRNFKKLVLQLTKTLLSNGIQVRLDMLESTLMSMSVSSWLDDNIQKCDFVVVCVSPSYKSEVEQQISTVTPDPHSLHTRYIYNRLLTEYIQNGSFNYRFIPVLIGGASRKDLPSLCLDTHVYEWPKDFEAIIYRLFKKEKYIQPPVGPPPRCTVETYDSYDEKVLNAHSSSRGHR